LKQFSPFGSIALREKYLGFKKAKFPEPFRTAIIPELRQPALGEGESLWQFAALPKQSSLTENRIRL
jgi:hypothetical protein